MSVKKLYTPQISFQVFVSQYKGSYNTTNILLRVSFPYSFFGKELAVDIGRGSTWSSDHAVIPASHISQPLIKLRNSRTKLLVDEKKKNIAGTQGKWCITRSVRSVNANFSIHR